MLQKLLKQLVTLSLFAGALAVQAGTPSFTAIDQNDLENVVKDFSSIFAHSTVSPASSLGTLFGIELGLIGGTVKTPNIDTLVNEASPGTSADTFPHFTLLGAISVPFGITGEFNFLPSLDTGDIKAGRTSIGVKWTITDSIVDFGPFDLAVRGFYTTSELSFSQTISSVPAEVDVKNSITGLQLIASMDFVIVEPYVGFGTLSADGTVDITASGGATFFDFGGQSASAKPTSTQYFAGIQANLLFFRLGFEYGHLFDSDRMDLKFSFKF